MKVIKFFDYWFRSRSFGFAWSNLLYWLNSKPHRTHRLAMNPGPAALCSIQWNDLKLWYRKGTSDVDVIYRILLSNEKHREYRVPEFIQPKIIWDIGGNIGISSVWLATQFPNAEIYCFEPVPENLEILRKNVSYLKNVKIMPFALGTQSGTLEISASDNPTNLGGFTFQKHGANTQRSQSVAIRRASDVFKELGSPSLDLIKIDTEGSEYEILTALPEEAISRAHWIMGELHGTNDFKLLAYLERWFDIGINKSVENRLSLFQARSLLRQNAT